MKLAELFSIFTNYYQGDDFDSEVKGLTSNHKEVKPQSVFVAVRGTHHDGHESIPRATAAGAMAIVAEDAQHIPTDFKGARVVVESSRVALAHLADRFFGQPTKDLFFVGVTGTNGKTSTTLMIEKVLNDFGWLTGVMGTIDHHVGERHWISELTTPDPVTLYRRLGEFRAVGAKAAAFEVSSHALAQGRADSVPFDVAVFTNLTRDHLDYHKTMDNYFAAKERLFFDLPLQHSAKKGFAIVNTDDEWGRRLRVADHWQKISYGEAARDFRFEIKASDFSGSRFTLKTQQGTYDVFIPVPGAHNVYNAVAAIAVGWAAGRSIESSIESLGVFPGVPGRLQTVPNPQGIHVFVDYAHTDDALRTVLQALQVIRRKMARTQTVESPSPRIVLVFGCGGDRDKGKRPLMARAAADGAEHIVVTSDNPRSEDPSKIVSDIMAGFSPEEKDSGRVTVQIDRRQAIGEALQVARPGDVVLIAGKGHEDYQIVGEDVRPFSDVVVAKEILDALSVNP
jgi:UDP-N-acetylmuramoyl-L-alanyl-D-glutamate--2,6-diaminopimelate ligase